MPVLKPETSALPNFISNRHFQTLYANVLRRVNGVEYFRERIITPDDDFLDIDWSVVGAETLCIISHGLEGSSHRPYVKGMVKSLNTAGYDCVAWNFRSCSGEMNLQPRFYHGGSTDDLETVIQHAINNRKYTRIVLVGFSLGANIGLKYLGERGVSVAGKILASASISVPCDLASTVEMLHQPDGKMYMNFFLWEYKRKLKAKAKMMPGVFSLEGLDDIKTMLEFDQRFQAPFYGFESAEEFYAHTSSRPHIPDIKVPSLIINSLDDPFLGKNCYPHEESDGNDYVLLEVHELGGHVGFYTWEDYYTEKRVIEWLGEVL